MVALRSLDILSVCHDTRERMKWKEFACFAWKTSILYLIEKSQYNDDDIKEILRLRDTSPYLSHTNTRIKNYISYPRDSMGFTIAMSDGCIKKFSCVYIAIYRMALVLSITFIN
jgi:hypothetical protein